MLSYHFTFACLSQVQTYEEFCKLLCDIKETCAHASVSIISGSQRIAFACRGLDILQ
jgi:hypothetical protein